MPASLSEYYRILGLSDTATLADIKRAYRIKSREWHPDVNKTPGANEQFLLITEAYQYLVDYIEGNINNYNQYTTTANTETTTEPEDKRAWAREYARKRWEEYYNSPEYRMTQALNNVLNIIMYIIFWSVIIVVPIATTISFGISGLIICLIPLSILFYYAAYRMPRENKVDVIAFWSSIKYIGKNRWLYFIGISLTNIILFLKIGLQTLMPLWLLFAIAWAPALAFLYYFKYHKKEPDKLRQIGFSFGYWPLLFNLFLLFNFAGSRNPTYEKYYFTCSTDVVKNGHRQETSYIILENNAYAEYPGIRYFLNYDDIKGRSTVTYTFADGLFGLRVMKSYEFNFDSEIIIK